MRRSSILITALVFTCCSPSQDATAAKVGYMGNVFSEAGTPVSGGFVIAGTFAPGFEPFEYNCVYGDGSCNLLSGAYDSAVADGNFIPIGPGTNTDLNGAFFAVGDTFEPAGTQLWLFAFEDNSRDSFFQVLASSSSMGWQVPTQPTGLTLLTASDAELFVLGASHPQGVALSVIPFPEPSSWALSVLGCFAALGTRSRLR